MAEFTSLFKGLQRFQSRIGGVTVKLYLRWKFNPRLIPVTIEERIRLWRSMHESMENDLKADAVRDWGIYNSVSAGFSIVEGDEESVFESLKKWIPNVVFDIKPIQH